MRERKAFDEWVQKNGGGLRSMEVGSVMWNRAREAFRAGWDAAGAVERTVACPHWEPGRITMRAGCEGCEADRASDGLGSGS